MPARAGECRTASRDAGRRASIAERARSGDAASDTTAQVLLSMKILPSSFACVPILTPLAVMPRMYHSPSHSSFSHAARTFSASRQYFCASSVRPRNSAASTNARSAQWCRNETMALSPPPRFRQSFQSARRPLQMPVGPTCSAEKSSARLRCSYTRGRALIGERDFLVEQRDVAGLLYVLANRRRPATARHRSRHRQDRGSGSCDRASGSRSVT